MSIHVPGYEEKVGRLTRQYLGQFLEYHEILGRQVEDPQLNKLLITVNAFIRDASEIEYNRLRHVIRENISDLNGVPF